MGRFHWHRAHIQQELISLDFFFFFTSSFLLAAAQTFPVLSKWHKYFQGFRQAARRKLISGVPILLPNSSHWHLASENKITLTRAVRLCQWLLSPLWPPVCWGHDSSKWCSYIILGCVFRTGRESLQHIDENLSQMSYTPLNRDVCGWDLQRMHFKQREADVIYLLQ